jgi:hypothetical protein
MNRFDLAREPQIRPRREGCGVGALISWICCCSKFKRIQHGVRGTTVPGRAGLVQASRHCDDLPWLLVLRVKLILQQLFEVAAQNAVRICALALR